MYIFPKWSDHTTDQGRKIGSTTSGSCINFGGPEEDSFFLTLKVPEAPWKCNEWIHKTSGLKSYFWLQKWLFWVSMLVSGYLFWGGHLQIFPFRKGLEGCEKRLKKFCNTK